MNLNTMKYGDLVHAELCVNCGEPNQEGIVFHDVCQACGSTEFKTTHGRWKYTESRKWYGVKFRQFHGFQPQAAASPKEDPEYSVQSEETHRIDCCIDHGCNYNDPNCPVVTAKIRQMFVCDDVAVGICTEEFNNALWKHRRIQAGLSIDEESPAEVDVDDVGVHRTHCCVIHGCKYGDKRCPVAYGQVKQEYICEDCHEIEGWTSLDDVKAKVKQQMGGMLPYVTPDQYELFWMDKPEPQFDMLPFNGMVHHENNLMDISEPSEPSKDSVVGEPPAVVEIDGVNYMRMDDEDEARISNWVAGMTETQKKIHDGSTIRLLEVLGELTVDLEINNDVTAMNFAGTRLKRYEDELDAMAVELAQAEKYIQKLEKDGIVLGEEKHEVLIELVKLIENAGSSVGIAHATVRAEEIFTAQEKQINDLIHERKHNAVFIERLKTEVGIGGTSTDNHTVMQMAVERIESLNEDLEMAHLALRASEKVDGPIVEMNQESIMIGGVVYVPEAAQPENIEVDGMIYVPVSLKDFADFDFIDDTTVEEMAGKIFNNLVKDYENLRNEYHDQEDKLNTIGESATKTTDALMRICEIANLPMDDAYSNTWYGTINNASNFIERREKEFDELLMKHEVMRAELNQATIYYKDCDVKITWYENETYKFEAAGNRLLEVMGMGGAFVDVADTMEHAAGFIERMQEFYSSPADKKENDRRDDANRNLLAAMGVGVHVYMGATTTMENAIGFIEKIQNDLTNTADAWRESSMEAAQLKKEIERMEPEVPVEIDSIIFNEMCAEAAMQYCISYYDKELRSSGYSPYNNMEQLVWIFDLVCNYCGEPVFITGGTGAKSNFMGDYMREYVYENVGKL